ncbi:glycoside hydrolase family 43 protein [Rhizosaccharibacter radicis]|uniref:Glycoside hydrolase family 43 protein n=1 Tax=Rhizosaccharibacter radicis TaxID=2782605 RepID=A0ABT1W1F9_9PROT|nr:glycoside hydrolase family 43 protein [Acetobacteraceae bacterium KSS12]
MMGAAGSTACWRGALGAASAAFPKLDAFHPGAIWPDDRGVPINAHGGGVLHHGGRYWWFGEHKIAGEAGNRAHVGVHCYSSRDLYNWRDEGIALAVSSDPTSLIADDCVIERPKVIRNPRTGMFVMWFHLELRGQDYSAARAGVAVSHSPAGPYRFLGTGRVDPGRWPVGMSDADRRPGSIVARDLAGGQMSRDMTLFVDDDGTAYHLFSSEDNRTLDAAVLRPDWLGHDGRYARILPEGRNEAPAIFKARGRYWLFASGTTGWDPNPARLYVAERVFGPWRALGNPVRGTPEQVATTFGGQSSFVLSLPPGRDGHPRAIFMADRWQPKNAIDGRYVWLPIAWENDQPVLRWHESWTLDQL